MRVSWKVCLVSTQVPLIFRSTRSAKLPFFQKTLAVVMFVEFARIQDYEERGEGVYAQGELNIRANAPSPLLSEPPIADPPRSGQPLYSGQRLYGLKLL